MTSRAGISPHPTAIGTSIFTWGLPALHRNITLISRQDPTSGLALDRRDEFEGCITELRNEPQAKDPGTCGKSRSAKFLPLAIAAGAQFTWLYQCVAFIPAQGRGLRAADPPALRAAPDPGLKFRSCVERRVFARACMAAVTACPSTELVEEALQEPAGRFSVGLWVWP